MDIVLCRTRNKNPSECKLSLLTDALTKSPKGDEKLWHLNFVGFFMLNKILHVILDVNNTKKLAIYMIFVKQ